MMRNLIILAIGLCCSVSAQADTLNELLQRAYKSNVGLKAAAQSYRAQKSLITATSTLDDPMFGVSTLNRGSKTTYQVISQKVRFPVKYYLQNKMQKSHSLSIKSDMSSQKFFVRMQVIQSYYSIYALQKIIQLTEANMQSVREFSRLAERKYAAGKARQGDSMKAHFELTQLQLELIRFKQEEQAMQSQLRSLLNEHDYKALKIASKELQVPHFSLKSLAVPVQQQGDLLKKNSPEVHSEIHKLEQLKWRSQLAKWEFAPDIQLQYQKRISGDPEDSEIYSVSLSIPLWFWRKAAEASAANAEKMAQEYRVEYITNSLLAKVSDLAGKVEAGYKTLKIYKTSLIPQAQGAYNASKSTYRANSTSILDLLDSERSLFRVKTNYYQSLRQYVRYLAQLEMQLGFEISNFSKLSGDKI